SGSSKASTSPPPRPSSACAHGHPPAAAPPIGSSPAAAWPSTATASACPGRPGCGPTAWPRSSSQHLHAHPEPSQHLRPASGAPPGCYDRGARPCYLGSRLVSPTQLAAAFVAASGALDAPADLGERLLALVLAAQAAHPKVRLDDERFIRHLARHR